MSKQILSYVAASYPILWVDTIEYQRAIENLSSVVSKINHESYQWDIQNGIKNLQNNTVQKGNGDPVEPNNNGEWIADMNPVNGPVLGPFKTRSEALDEEIKWLEQNIF